MTASSSKRTTQAIKTLLKALVGFGIAYLLINVVLAGVALKLFRALEPRFAEHV